MKESDALLLVSFGLILVIMSVMTVYLYRKNWELRAKVVTWIVSLGCVVAIAAAVPVVLGFLAIILLIILEGG